MKRWFATFAASLAVACAAMPQSAGHPPASNKDAPMGNSTLQWQPHTSELLGLSLDLPAGAKAEEGSAGELRYLLARSGDVRVGAWIGPGQDLSGWRARLVNREPRVTIESAATLCGRPARRQEAALSPEQATGATRDSAGSLREVEHRVPAQVEVAVAGSLANGTAVLVAWTVVSDRRDAHRADEEHFIASIRCR
jgi:hypothetical protein